MSISSVLLRQQPFIVVKEKCIQRNLSDEPTGILYYRSKTVSLVGFSGSTFKVTEYKGSESQYVIMNVS